MDFLEIYNKFLQMEDEFDLFEQKICGVYFWEHVRFIISRIIFEKNVNTGVVDAPNNLLTLYRTFISSIPNYIFKNPYLVSPKDFLFIGHTRRKLGHDGLFWDLYCDPVIDYLGSERCLLLERYYFNSHLTPCKTYNIKYLDFISTYAFFKTQFMCRQRVFPNSERLLTLLQQYILDNLFCEVNIRGIVEKRILNHLARLPLYIRLLKTIKPKLMFIVCSYGHETIIEAAKKCSIPVVELQHGLINKYHLGYAFPGKGKKRSFPNFLFVFGDFWRENIAYPINQNKIFTIGYPYLEDEVEKYSSKKKKQILFISAPKGKELSLFAVELKKIIPNDIKIIYKLHPLEFVGWQDEYPWLKNSGIIVVDGDKPNLYELLAESKWQVGVASTAIYEGIAFGCQTYIVDLPAATEYMGQLTSKGHAKLVNTPQQVDLNFSCDDIIDTNYFFADNWQERFDMALQNLPAINS